MTIPKPGDRIRLVAMPNDPDPIPIGATGTVTDARKNGSGTVSGFRWTWYGITAAS